MAGRWLGGRRPRWLALRGLGVLSFSMTLPATRVAVQELDGTVVGLGRALVAAALAAAALAALVLAVRREPLPGRQHLLGLAIVGAGVVVGFPLLSAWAKYSTRGNLRLPYA